jgi:hypothetical protein
MKKSILLILISLLGVGVILAQPCEEVKIDTTPAKRNLLVEYLDQCFKQRLFVEDKGIVRLEINYDSLHQERWNLSVMIDDRYKDDPPTKYSRFNDNLFLVYDKSKKITKPVNVEPILACLEEVIEDRVYIRPPKKVYHTTIEVNGITKKVQRVKRIQIAGNYWKELIIIFQKDGTYKTLKPV